MANTLQYVDVYNAQPTTGLNKSNHQPLLVFAYVNDGAGNPCADGTTVYVTQWVKGTWGAACAPVSVNVNGGAIPFTTKNGFVVVSNGFGPFASTRLLGWFVSLTNTTGTGPNFSVDLACTGGVDASGTIFATSPKLVGIPGDTTALWVVKPGTLLDDRGFARLYGYSVTTGTPSATPSGTPTTPQKLSTGLTNGTTYNARATENIDINGTVGSSVTNIAHAVPAPQGPFWGVRYA